MKKLALFLAVAVLLPTVAMAGITKDGDPGWHISGSTPWPDTTFVIAGQSYTSPRIGATNWGIASTLCTLADTFCVVQSDQLGWAISWAAPGPTTGGPFILDPGFLFYYYLHVDVPCSVTPGDLNIVTLQMAYADETTCYPDSGDCEDPNIYGGVPKYSIRNQPFRVVESPPALYILQDTLYFVEQGQTAAYIPFSICNGDPCAPPTGFSYVITSTGVVGPAINQSGSIIADGGACVDVYGVIDGGAANVCDYDLLTIVVWDTETGTVYDTCVQEIHVVTPVPVPLMTAPVVTILVLAMILAAAVIMKRHAVSKA